jgi:hypothetical protein
MAKVIVAAISKWMVRIPNDPKELYELDLEEYAKKGKFRIDSTPTLKYVSAKNLLLYPNYCHKS